MMTLNGATRLHVIVGDPIAQVKSPEGLTKGFASRGQNAVVVPIHVTPADLDAFFDGASRVQNLDSIIATIPHKFACYAHCAEASDRAHFLRAAQTLRRLPDGRWYGDNFDGVGFVNSLLAKGCQVQGARALLIGAGGAGSAIAYALIEAGVRELAIHDSDKQRLRTLIERLRERATVPVREGSTDPTGYDLVANATPAGMRPGDPLPVMVDRLSPEAFAGCVITAPPVSPFIEAARARGCRTAVGTDMFAAVAALMLDFLMPPEPAR